MSTNSAFCLKRLHIQSDLREIPLGMCICKAKASVFLRKNQGNCQQQKFNVCEESLCAHEYWFGQTLGLNDDRYDMGPLGFSALCLPNPSYQRLNCEVLRCGRWHGSGRQGILKDSVKRDLHM